MRDGDKVKTPGGTHLGWIHSGLELRGRNFISWDGRDGRSRYSDVDADGTVRNPYTLIPEGFLDSAGKYHSNRSFHYGP